jgi:uncharacterized protein (DUF488 family)
VDLPFFTIGHSNRSIEAFVELLREAQVELLADVRKIPMSRANPQFNGDLLAASLAAFQIGYDHISELGGLRGKARGVPADVNGFWTNESFHNYADYALSGPFHAGLERLLEEGSRRRCAIMCSEAVWWRCHRRIVADYLIAAGRTVFHIMGNGQIQPAHLTPGAIVRDDHTVIYPAVERSNS